jgi:hypothetical protein
VVANPKNDSHWRMVFSETYAYTEGKSSVTVVRDTPVNFRVQSGTNNPTALIEGQLQVTRAIAGAAITVAGAGMGIPLPKLPNASGKADSLSDTSPAGDTAEADRLAHDKVQLEAKREARAQAIRNLQNNLLGLRDQLATVADDKDRLRLLSKLKSVLEGHKPFFATPEPAAADKK